MKKIHFIIVFSLPTIRGYQINGLVQTVPAFYCGKQMSQYPFDNSINLQTHSKSENQKSIDYASSLIVPPFYIFFPSRPIKV